MFFNIAQRFRDYRSRREVDSFMARMNDHDLRDIGLTRCDLGVAHRRSRSDF